MNALEKLQWMIEICCTVSVEVNDHRAGYETIEQAIEQANETNDGQHDEADAACIVANRRVTLRVYPNTPIGSFVAHGPDLEPLIHRLYPDVRAEVERRTAPAFWDRTTAEVSKEQQPGQPLSTAERVSGA